MVPEVGEEDEGGAAGEDGADAAHLGELLLVPVQHLHQPRVKGLSYVI